MLKRILKISSSGRVFVSEYVLGPETQQVNKHNLPGSSFVFYCKCLEDRITDLDPRLFAGFGLNISEPASDPALFNQNNSYFMIDLVKCKVVLYLSGFRDERSFSIFLT